MFKRLSKICIVSLLIAGMMCQSTGAAQAAGKSDTSVEVSATLTLEKIRLAPEGDFMKEAAFPDRLGRIDDTLAMNSMMSFKGYQGQGRLYVTVDEDITGFTMYINENRVDTSQAVDPGVYELDYSGVSENGLNTVQITGIRPVDAKGKVHVQVPYPAILDGSIEDSGINHESLSLVEDIIASDVDNGFTSAQLAVIRNGKFVYENAWGKVNSYLPDGTLNEAAPNTTVDTLYDLASVTKMFGVNYALQKLVTDGQIGLDDKVSQYFGDRFFEDTIELEYINPDNPEGFEGPGIMTQKQWKSDLTIRNLLRHQGGFPASPKYYNRYVDAATQQLGSEYDNVLYAGSGANEATKEATIEAICRTPLKYEPGTQTVYSDVDYMILGVIIETVTGMNLDEYIKETFCTPMGLTHITYRPLDNGFTRDDCAATELNGNTRDNSVDFPGVRAGTVQGEVHDETAYYSMAGISGHAGLFANASDLARLASVMLTGGYENTRFFSQNAIDMFTSPKNEGAANWGLGWYREGDDQRSWYFGSETGTGTIGHQGWTGTLVMIDPEKDLVIVYLTNKINSPIADINKDINRFDGGNYTASTLGFVPQLLSVGFDSATADDIEIDEQLMSLLDEMTIDSMRLVDNARANDSEYSRVKNVDSKLSLYGKKAKELGRKDYIAEADELVKLWEQYKEKAARTPEALLNRMSLKEKIEQMIITDVRYWPDGEEEKAGVTKLNDELQRVLSEHDFGGIILYSENVENVKQTTELVSEIRDSSRGGNNRISPFISADQEGGRVTRLKTGTQLPGNMAIGAIAEYDAAYEEGQIAGEELAALGFNVDFAPVVDINNNPANPVIDIRSFSDGAELVSAMSKGYIDGLHNADIISSVKHYPGHGDTSTDSHTGLPMIDKSYEEISAMELVPYRECLENGYEMVMTAHIQYPQIEDETYRSIKDGSQITLPATMSAKILGKLRKDIGFDGVIISDAMDMGAIAENFDRRDAAAYAVNAGIDILLNPAVFHSPEEIVDYDRFIEDLVEMVEDGRISAQRVDESVLRILKLKDSYGLLNEEYGEDAASSGDTDPLDVVGSAEHHEREWELAKKAVTLVRNNYGVLPVNDKTDNKISVICRYDSEVLSVQYAIDRLKEEGLVNGCMVDIISAEKTDLSDKNAFADAAEADKVIVISAMYGFDELDPNNENGAFAAAVDNLITSVHSNGGRVVLLSAQLPYDLARYPKADAALACYNAKGMSELPGDGTGETVQYGPNIPAAIYTIFDGNDPTGSLPVNIPRLNDKYEPADELMYTRGYKMEY